MMFEKQSKATSSADQVVASDFKNGSTEERNRIISNGSAEDDEESAASSMQHQHWSKRQKALAVAFMLLFVGAVAFAVAVFRPGGPGNSSIQSSQGQIFNSVPTFVPTKPRLDTDISEGATYFESKADKTKVKIEVSSDNGEGEGPGIKPIPSSAPPNPAPVQNTADGSGELPPAPTSPKPETPPFFETPFPMDTPIPTPMPSYAATVSITNVATGMGSGESNETSFPMDTPIPTPMPSYTATDKITTVATGIGMGSGEVIETPLPMDTPIPSSMPSHTATESITTVATGMGSGQGTETVSTETTGPPTLPNREPVPVRT